VQTEPLQVGKEAAIQVFNAASGELYGTLRGTVSQLPGTASQPNGKNFSFFERFVSADGKTVRPIKEKGMFGWNFPSTSQPGPLYSVADYMLPIVVHGRAQYVNPTPLPGGVEIMVLEQRSPGSLNTPDNTRLYVSDWP